MDFQFWHPSTKLNTYLPQLRLIGLGVDRLCGCTLTAFGPGLPTLSGRHFVLDKVSTSLQTVSTVQLPSGTIPSVRDRYSDAIDSLSKRKRIKK
jgi:hypothetical protein